VLGGILLDNRTILDVPASLKPELFYLPSHGCIFAAMLSLSERQAPIDVVSRTNSGSMTSPPAH
jgi:replicative DNA helicase